MNSKYLSQEAIFELLGHLKDRDKELSNCIKELNVTVKDLSQKLNDMQQEIARMKAIKHVLTSKVFGGAIIGLVVMTNDSVHVMDVIKLLGGF